MQHLFSILKFTLTLGLLWYVYLQIDASVIISKLDKKDMVSALLTGATVISIQVVIAAIRLKTCMRMLGSNISLINAWNACQLGGFFSYTPASFIGGDFVRAWHAVRCGVPLENAAKGIILDRVIGLVGMLILVISSAPAMFLVIKEPAMKASLALLLIASCTLIICFFFLGRLHGRWHQSSFLGRIVNFASLSRIVVLHPRAATKAIGLAVTMSALNAVTICLIGFAFGYEIGVYASAVATPIAFLIAMTPISVAGWGLREGALVVSLGLFGVAPEASLTASIAYGLSVIISYCPATVLLINKRKLLMSSPKSKEKPANF